MRLEGKTAFVTGGIDVLVNNAGTDRFAFTGQTLGVSGGLSMW